MTYASDNNWDEFLLIVNFACSTRTEEDGGCISFGNQEGMENILECARY